MFAIVNIGQKMWCPILHHLEFHMCSIYIIGNWCTIFHALVGDTSAPTLIRLHPPLLLAPTIGGAIVAPFSLVGAPDIKRWPHAESVELTWPHVAAVGFAGRVYRLCGRQGGGWRGCGVEATPMGL
jgi:hypothetical protein